LTAARLLDLGTRPYREVWDLQRRIHQEVVGGQQPDTWILVEHLPVITLGRQAKRENLLLSEGALRTLGVEVVEIERGGDVTYHGPGQLVGYPIVDLRAFDEDVVRYVRTLEAALIDALRAWGIDAGRLAGYPGVWTGAAKIAAIGVAVKRKVTMHGFALNVDPDLEAFDLINPCGLGRPVTSMARVLGRPVAVDEAVPGVASACEAALAVRWEPRTLDDLRTALGRNGVRQGVSDDAVAGGTGVDA
jgi:lipoate-protein ligase B